MPTPFTPAQTRITAVILAGGANTRMHGQPKALLDWNGQPFIAHIINALCPQATTLAISTQRPDLFAAFKLPTLADPFADARGPLAGMLAGLNFAQTEFTLFAPCDNPLISPVLAERLLAELIAHHKDIAFAQTGTDRHYLYAIMRSHLKVDLRDYFVRGDFSVHRWFATQSAIAVNFDDQPRCFSNINTAAALDALNAAALPSEDSRGQ